MRRAFALLYGLAAYIIFFGTFVYAIGFLGNVLVPKSVDSGPSSSLVSAILIDVLLLGAFAVQHSVMARPGFKRSWTRLVSWQVERSTYVLAASLVLALLLWQWRPIPAVVWDLSGTASATFLTVLFWMGWAFQLISTFLINHFELFGLGQVWAYFHKREFKRPAFRTPAFYRLVRHPIYLGFVIAFWAVPLMTAGHLLFSVAATGYIFVGIYFEERDLVGHHGQPYTDYSAHVPMLVPFLKRNRQKAKSTTA